MKITAIVLSLALLFSSCDQARNLVEPIDNTPIETTGETKFAITIKPVGDGYQTTLKITDLVILDSSGNQLPITSIDDIVVNTCLLYTSPSPRD